MSEQPDGQQVGDGGPGPTLGQVVEEGLRRLRRIWPRAIDGPEVLAEYRRVLQRLGTPEAVRAAVDFVIDHHDGQAPVPGALVSAGRDFLARQPADPKGEPRHVPSASDPSRYVLIYPDGRRYPPGVRTIEDTRGRR